MKILISFLMSVYAYAQVSNFSPSAGGGSQGAGWTMQLTTAGANDGGAVEFEIAPTMNTATGTMAGRPNTCTFYVSYAIGPSGQLTYANGWLWNDAATSSAFFDV